MSNGTPPARDALDNKANQLFAGKVVRKDLVRKVKVGANVPIFVLEFLLGKYCASSDEIAIQMGLQVVNDTLANNYIRPDESAKAQSKVKESGKYSFIDKVKVRLVDSDYWGEGVNFNSKFLHIPSQYVRDYERLLMGGVWAQVDMRFESDQESKGKNPFWIDKLVPIQIATFDLDEYARASRIVCSTILAPMSPEELEREGQLALEEAKQEPDGYIENWIPFVLSWDFLHRFEINRAKSFAHNIVQNARERSDPRALGLGLWLLGWVDNQQIGKSTTLAARISFGIGLACKIKRRGKEARMHFEQAREIAEPLKAAALLAKIDTALAELP
jgi:hypothetical protein